MEMYKVQNNCLPEIMNKVFPTNEPIYEYYVRNTSDFAARRINTARYGLESLSYLGPRLWNILLDEYKKLQSVKDFKAKIRSLHCSYVSRYYLRFYYVNIFLSL